MYPGTYAAAVPDRPAVIMDDSGGLLTYGDLNERSMRLAQLLAAHGLVEGGRVAIFAENQAGYFEAYWAAIRSGLYVTGVNWRLTAEEAGYIVANSGAKALITTVKMAEIAREMLSGQPDCRVRLVLDGTAEGFDSYRDAIAGYPAEDLPGAAPG